MNRRRFNAGLAAIGVLSGAAPFAAVRAQAGALRIAVLNDMSSVYADYQGIGSVIAARMATEDYGGKAARRAIEILSADHQNKPDVGAALARKWLDTQGGGGVARIPNSP